MTAATALAETPAPSPVAERPLFTIVLPTYGRPAKVERFLRYHTETFGKCRYPFEILVHDDCTPDETPDIVADWMRIDNRIRYVRHEKNQGFRPNFLGTMRAARGKYAIYAGNDDLLIAEIVEKYIERLESDPEIGMVHAPWFLLDETKSNRIMGTSWPLEEERRFTKGEHGPCLDMILTNHVFPEWFIMRTNLIPDVLATYSHVSYHFFAHLAHALMRTDVLFAREPFAIVTAISRGDVQVGNRETLEGWDEYRGGLEYFASFCTRSAGESLDGFPSLGRRIQDFTNTRMGVALGLHLGRRNWLTVWHLYRRLLAYGYHALTDEAAQEAQALAAMEAVVKEFERQNITTIVATEKVFAMMREVVNIPSQMRLACDTDDGIDDVLARETCGLVYFGAPAAAQRNERHMVLDLAAMIRRFEAL